MQTSMGTRPPPEEGVRLMDITESIAPKSDQVNADDFVLGPRTFTITDVRQGSSEQPVWIYLAEHPQPFKPSKTVLRLLGMGWGPETDAWHGKRLTLYRDETVKWAGKAVGGIRVSHMSGIGRKALTTMLPPSKGQRVPYTVEPIADDGPLPAKEPTALDRLVWAMNAAKIEKDARLEYCRQIVGRDADRELTSAADMTPDEMARVVESLQDAIAYEREQENQNG